MALSPLSPVMLIAADGLLNDQGLGVSSELTQAVNSYNNTSTVSSYTGVLVDAVAAIGVGNTNITASTIAEMQTLGDGILPALTNAVTSNYISQIGTVPDNYTGGLSELIIQQANRVMGNGDLTRFIQVFGMAQGYTFLVNQYVDSALQSDTLTPTFTDMDSFSTGTVSDISSNLNQLGNDLAKLGQAWDMNSLQYLGYPWMLIRQLSFSGGLTAGIVEKLLLAGVNITQLNQIAQATEPPSAKINAQLYRALKSITGRNLEEAKILLDVTTEGLTSLADLLNPVLALPNSYRTLKYRTFASATQSELVDVYLQADTVNSGLLSNFENDTVYQNLIKVIPADQALANQALAQALLQVKNIFIPALPAFAAAIQQVETFDDLPSITSLSEPVPASVVNNITGILGTGTGANGSVTLFDIIGSAAGVPYTEQYQIMTATINSLNSAGALTTLTDSSNGVFTVMANVLAGDYDDTETVTDPETAEETEEFAVVIPSGLPGAGTYDTYDAAFSTGLIPAAESLLADIASNNPVEASALNASIGAVVSSLASEINFQQDAQIDFDELAPNSTMSILSFATGLHSIGTDTGETGRAVYFEKIAERNNIAGQAIIAAMREGRNIAALNDASIRLDTQIPLQ